MKKANGFKFIGIIIALVSITLIAACSQQQSIQEGRAVFALTDAAADMGDVTNISITIDSVKVLSENGTWTVVSTTQQTYDLLKLKTDGTHVLLADYNLTPGTYQQTRLDVSKVIVTDASGDNIAKLPSGELKIVGTFTINENSTSTIEFDFLADESLHTTGNGLYIFAPVIKLETRQNADVDTRYRDNVGIYGGQIDDNKKIGMDINGNLGGGFIIRKDSRLSIKGDKITEEFD